MTATDVKPASLDKRPAARGVSFADPFVLLRSVRRLMAKKEPTQHRLDQLVAQIATGFGVEVCSIYLKRGSDKLELFATHGLNPQAVHLTRLRVGEGIVGEIAATSQPLALSNASLYPGYAYRPETGEAPYHAMMGVPLIHGGLVVGVLVVQNLAIRSYAQEEIETLATIGMVVAEIVGTENLTRSSDVAGHPVRLEGVRLSSGIGIGQVVLHRSELGLAETIVSDDPKAELARLESAMQSMYQELDKTIATHHMAGREVEEILRAFRVIAEDRGWIQRLKNTIQQGFTAEAAVIKSRNQHKDRIANIKDDLLRERINDFNDLANRLLRHLAAKQGLPAGLGALPERTVVVARNMGPTELLEYNQEKLQALVLLEGSNASHVAIVARAMGIPILGRVKSILSCVASRDDIIVDATNGACFLRPNAEVRRSALQSLAMQERLQKSYETERDLPSQTRDKQTIHLSINAGMLMDVPHLAHTGAAGIGLFRTELPLMLRSDMPSVEELTTFYQRIFAQAGDKPIVFRTYDIGSDKKVPFIPVQPEDNPALGWRAIRLGLDQPDLLKNQARALLQAAHLQATHLQAKRDRTLDLMFPMVSTVQEFIDAKTIVLNEQKQLALQNKKEAQKQKIQLRIGAMIEVPALVFQIPELSAHADFVSLGSNDLLQFLFAQDRGNPKLDGRYDPLDPAVLRFIKQLVDSCKKHGLPLSVCGEMAGSSLGAAALIGIGVRSLSMNPSAIGPIRRLVRQINLSALEEALNVFLKTTDKPVRTQLNAYMTAHQITIDQIPQIPDSVH